MAVTVGISPAPMHCSGLKMSVQHSPRQRPFPLPRGPHNIAASLPYELASSGTISQSIPLVVDNDTPSVAFTFPSDGEIIGGGVTSIVVGGISDDATSWVDRVEVSLPAQGTDYRRHRNEPLGGNLESA